MIDARLATPLSRSGDPVFVRMREWGDERFRLKLARWWSEPSDQHEWLPWLPWIMLNPSTADGISNDQTLLRIIRFTWRWGFNGLWAFNIYPHRTPSPKELARVVLGWAERGDWHARDEILHNHGTIAAALAHADAVMVAWGAPAGSLGEETDLWLEQLFDKINDPEGPRAETLKLWCLGNTRHGAPVHPMARGVHRIPDDTRPIRFENPGTISIGKLVAECGT